jgi:hypothetical protein
MWPVDKHVGNVKNNDPALEAESLIVRPRLAQPGGLPGEGGVSATAAPTGGEAFP